MWRPQSDPSRVADHGAGRSTKTGGAHIVETTHFEGIPRHPIRWSCGNPQDAGVAGAVVPLARHAKGRYPVCTNMSNLSDDQSGPQEEGRGTLANTTTREEMEPSNHIFGY